MTQNEIEQLERKITKYEKKIKAWKAIAEFEKKNLELEKLENVKEMLLELNETGKLQIFNINYFEEREIHNIRMDARGKIVIEITY